MAIITDNKKANAMIILFTLTYLISYMTRVNYAAVIAEIVRAEGILKSQASMALVGSFAFYGAGQLVSGYMGDRIQPRTVVFYGLIISTVSNVLIPLCGSALQMAVIWCINGGAQALIWPPIVKLMSELFSGNTYKKASVVISWGSAIGTMLVYLISSICVKTLGWKLLFYICAICGLGMALVWARNCPRIELIHNQTNNNRTSSNPLEKKCKLPIIILAIMAAIIFQGALRDGVTTWMPSYILETFHLESSAAILTGIILPAFSIVSFQITAWIYRKKLTNELVCSGMFFGAGFLNAILLYLFPSASPISSVLLSALLTGCIHGVNLILVCYIPPYFKKSGRVSFVSGLLNSCTYVGSAASTYGIAVFSEHFGWKSTILLWSLIALAGTFLCLGISKAWKRFTRDNGYS